MNTIENKNKTVKVSGEKIWKKHSFFNAIKCDFNMEKVNYPENTLFYKNQAYLTVKKNKKIFYCDYFILGQIVESSNPPENILSYNFRENEFRIIGPKYDTSTGEFKGLYETIGFLVARGAPDEIFFSFGYDQNKSKVLYSHYRRKIPSSFSGTIFNRHRSLIENEKAENDYSNILFVLPSITDRSEEINKYLNNVSVTPIDISRNIEHLG